MGQKKKLKDEHPTATLEEHVYQAGNGEEVLPKVEEIDTLEERKELIEDLFERVEAYAKTNVELLKAKAVDKVSLTVASLVSGILVLIFFLCFFLMINIGVAIWLGEVLGHVYYGFFIVAGLYALIAIILHTGRNTMIRRPIINSILSQFLK